MSIAANPEKNFDYRRGDGLAVREILKYEAVKSVTVADMDPGNDGAGKDASCASGHQPGQL